MKILSSRRSLSLSLALSLALVLSLGISARSAAPRDELLRLVPDDMTFCTIVQDLRERAKNGKENSILSKVVQLPFVRDKMESPEFKKLLDIQMKVCKDLEITPEQLRDDLLGDAVVFAYRQGPAGKPEQDQGLFLLWARDKALLAQVLDRINDVQKKTGELKELRTLKHDEQTYYQRIKVKDKERESEYYFVRDNAIVFSPQEALLKAAIERGRLADDKRPAFWVGLLDRLGLDRSLLVLLINPRVFDGELQSRERAAQGEERAFLKEFRKYWHAFEGLAIYADIDEQLELGFAVRVRKEALPVAAQKFFAELGKPSALWKIVPDDCLLALSSRLDSALLAEVFSSFCAENRIEQISKSIAGSVGPFLPGQGKLTAFLKGLGPDWGFWAFAPAAVDKTSVPQFLFAVQVRPSTEGTAADTSVRKAVQFLATMAQFSAQEHLRVETTKQDELETTTLTHDTLLPPGLRPSFASKDGYLLFAGAPETIRRFVPPAKEANEPGETPLLRISAKGWRNYLSAYKNEIADYLSKTSGMTAKETVCQIDAIVENLRVFDRLEIVVRTKADRATVAIRLKAVAKK